MKRKNFTKRFAQMGMKLNGSDALAVHCFNLMRILSLKDYLSL